MSIGAHLHLHAAHLHLIYHSRHSHTRCTALHWTTCPRLYLDPHMVTLYPRPHLTPNSQCTHDSRLSPHTHDRPPDNIAERIIDAMDSFLTRYLINPLTWLLEEDEELHKPHLAEQQQQQVGSRRGSGS